MAYIGLRYPVVATMASHTAGAEPTYNNTGMVIGKAIAANLTITRNNNPLYADDAIAEDDNGITAMSMELGTDDILEDVQEYMLGTYKVTGQSGAPTLYYDSDASAPKVGFGYYRVRKKAGVVKYQAIWYYQAVFGTDSENAATKGESIDWQTPTITGRCAALSVDSTGSKKFRVKAVFDTETDAINWLKTKANFPT